MACQGDYSEEDLRLIKSVENETIKEFLRFLDYCEDLDADNYSVYDKIDKQKRKLKRKLKQNG